MTDPEQAQVEPASRAEWRAWLTENADIGHGVWLILHKGKGAQLTYDEAVEEAVAFGWIDSKANRLDEQRYKQWMGPRRPRSGWAASNKARVERLGAAGLMTERGRRLVEEAKADGSWEKLDGGRELGVPARQEPGPDNDA